MKPIRWISVSFLPLAVLLLAGAVCAQESATIQPGSQQAAQVMQQLEQAEHIDRANSTSWTDSAPSLDHYYSRKAREVHQLIAQLQKGEAVSSTDVNHALYTKEAGAFGGTF